jgi:hypothetical protein
MSAAKYTQLHRQLLFHWTGKKDGVVIKPITRKDRTNYLDLLAKILENGLRFSHPGSDNTEWIEKGLVEAIHPMLCFSEWGVSESAAHSGRYGFMGLGFTRRFVMKQGGRPVVYVDNSKKDPFRMAILGLMRAAKAASEKDANLKKQIEIVSSHFKAYHFKREPDKKKTSSESKKREVSETTAKLAKDSHLKINFGGLLANLEDREWRVLGKSADTQEDTYLGFSPGDLAMIVFPDHQTLSLAMRNSTIMTLILRDRYGPPMIGSRKLDTGNAEKPCVCLVSREMIHSM